MTETIKMDLPTIILDNNAILDAAKSAYNNAVMSAASSAAHRAAWRAANKSYFCLISEKYREKK